MMGHENHQGKLFCYDVNLEKRLRSDHPLRKINEFVDFEFIYKGVKSPFDSYQITPPLSCSILYIYYSPKPK